MAVENSRRTLVVVAAVVAALLLVVLFLGLEEVPEGQVHAVPDGSGGVAAVWEPGWHWRAPWADPPLALPSGAIAASPAVEMTTAEGATIHLEAAGRFAVTPDGVPAWIRAAGWRPFVEGIGAVLASGLEPMVRTRDPAALFEDAAQEELGRSARRVLEEAGLTVADLTVTAPVEKNPVAVAAIRNRLGRLARPTGTKVLVVGWDGADWLMARPLLEAGRLPNLAKLVRGGVSGELRSQEPLLSPLIWTTIATGRTVEEHGIADFLVEDPATGGMVPISSTSRRVHALWTLLPAFGLTTDVVAWWASWPAEPIQGTLVSDRVAYQLVDFEGSEDPEGKVHPPSAWPRIQELLVPAEEVGWDEVGRFVDVPEAELERRWNALPPDRRQEDPVNHLRKIIATTKSYHAIALDLLQEQADLTLVYLEGTDTVGHLFARHLPPRMPGIPQEDVERYGQALPRFYEWADELLGELLAAVEEDTLVLLISDHGFFTGRARPESDPSDFDGGGAPHWHRLYGVIAGDGPGIDRAEITGATIFDIAPTLLAALGLPIPEDMKGEPLTPLLPPAARRSLPEISGQLASYEVLPRQRPTGSRVADEEDEERLRELVALGYISAAALEERRGPAAPGGADPGDAEPRVSAESAAGNRTAATAPSSLQGLATEAYNLGRIAQREGRLDEAERQYRIAVERMPGFGVGWSSLAQVESLRGNHSAAFQFLVQGFSKSSGMPQSAITGLVDEAAAAGRLDDAERALEGLRRPLSDVSAYHAAWGLLRQKRGDLPGALAAYEQALALDPLDPLSVEQKVGILRRQDRVGEARAFLSSSFESAASVSSMNQLAIVALRQGWPADAERLLRVVLESDPGNPGVLANLAAAQAQQGKLGPAAETMARAIERDPDNAGNHFNLGAMLASQGRAAEALRAFQRAMELGLRTPRVHVATAKMHFRLGDPVAAEGELERALEVDPGHAEARELLTILRQGG